MAASPFPAVFVAVSVAELEGTQDDPIGRVAGLAFMDGQIVVADRFQSNLKVFASDGRRLRAIGRPGDGPGEFRRPVSVTLAGDELVVVDDRRASMIFFDRTGTYGRTVALPGLAHGPAVRLGRRSQFAIPFSLRTAGDYGPTALFAVDTTGAIVDTLGRIRPPGNPMEGSALYLRAAASDSVLAWTVNTSNEVHFTSLGTGRTWSARVAAANYRPPQWPERPLGVGDSALQWLRSQTWVAGIHALDAERFIVRFSTGGEGRLGLHSHYYAVVSASGETLAVTEPTDVEIVAAENGRAFGITMDDDGDVSLTTYSLDGVMVGVAPEPGG